LAARSYEEDVDYALEKDGERRRGGEEGAPYHTRYDSKPFSYIRQNPSAPTSRAASRERSGLGLESPALLRRVIATENGTQNGAETPPLWAPPPAAARATESPQSSNEAHSSQASSGGSSYQHISNGAANRSVILDALNSTSSVLENSFAAHSGNNSETNGGGNCGNNGVAERGEEERMSWLHRQQQKLQERRDGQKKTQQESAFLIKELKTSLERARSGGTETTDGYASDANSLLCSETSREPSPAKQQIYQVPLQVEERGSVQQGSKIQSSFQNSDLRGANSETRARSSSELGTRSSESGFHSSESSSQQAYSSVQTSESSNQQIYSSVQKRSMTPSMSTKKAAELKSLLNRQRSDTSYDRSWPGVQRRRQDSESEAELSMLRTNGAQNGSCGSIDSAGMLCGGSRPITPAFPQVPGTPLFNQSSNSNGLQTSTLPPKSPGSALLQGNRHNSRPDLTYRAPSPAGSFYQADPNLSSRRGSVSSEPTDVAASHVRLVKENHKWWYKPHITREDAINLLKSQSPGTFIVRDSNTFPDSFGLALKVATPPQNGQQRSNGQQSSEELVRHFLIEPTSKGVKLKGYSNEPVFASLSALIYQHTLTPLALPIRLVLPQADLGPAGSIVEPSASTQMQQLLQQGAACNLHYLFSMDTDQLTGPQAVRKTVSQLFLTRPVPSPTTVHFKVSGQGITLTDNARKLFFRKHYNVNQISHCGVDPEDRKWSLKSSDGSLSAPNKLFAFVARKAASRACNQCHVFAELDLDQPARAIVNFVNKLMMSTSNGSAGRPADMV